MFDKSLVLGTLQLIEESLQTINRRTSHISTVQDFLLSEEGMILLDSVCMKLTAIGESVKNLDKISNKQLLIQYKDIPWKEVMGLRDIIVHHYFDVDAYQIFKTLKEDLPPLLHTIQQMIKTLT